MEIRASCRRIAVSRTNRPQCHLKTGQANSILPAALSVSLAVHAVILIGVRFVVPEFQHWYTIAKDPPILLNSPDGPAPIHAELEAQVNHDGGGNADSGHAKSPLPDMQKTEEGEAVKSVKRRTDVLESEMRELYTQLQKRNQTVAPVPEKNTPQPTQGNDNTDSEKEFARRAAEIDKEVDDYNKRPHKTQITPSTKRAEYALYYSQVKAKIEKVGTLHFPASDGKKLYGELILHIPIYQDGTLYLKDGGPSVEHTSGNRLLDRAALRIVENSAPFTEFPRKMLSANGDVWEVTVTFKFTREEGLQTVLGGGQ